METQSSAIITNSEEDTANLIKALELEIQTLKQEQSRSLDTITRKNGLLDTQRIKIKQYEFAIQEAMNYLAKPLNTFEEWMNGETAEDFDQYVDVGHRKTKSNPYLNQSTETSNSFIRRSLGQAPAKATGITTHAKSISTPPTTEKSKREVQDFSKLEITCLESMRIGFNFLRNCQKQNNAIDMGTYVIPESAVIKGENEALALVNFNTEKDDEVENEHKEAEPRSSFSPTHKVYSYPKIDESGEGDLSTTGDDSELKSPMSVHKCERCHNSLLKIDALNEKLDSANKLIYDLEGRLHKEIKSKKASQQAKEMMDKEIEDITAELFARANQMVIDESRKVEELYAANKELTKQMQEAAARLKERELELFQASQCLHELQSTTIHSSSFSKQVSVKKSGQNSEVPSPTNKIPSEFNHTIIAGFDRFPTSMAVDGFIFQEFQELIKVMVLSASMPALQAFQAIHGTLFMKRCQIEDVEPCLFYNYQTNNTFKAHGPGLAQSFKKKVLDLCIRGQVHTSVVEITEKSPIPKTKCLMCTAIRECEYLVKLGPIDIPKPEVAHSCRACRDRLVAVVDFFNFITFISANTQGATILSTFKQVLWLRRRMQLARIGSSSMFETEVTAMLGPGGAGDWEKNIDRYNLPGQFSIPLSLTHFSPKIHEKQMAHHVVDVGRVRRRNSISANSPLMFPPPVQTDVEYLNNKKHSKKKNQPGYTDWKSRLMDFFSDIRWPRIVIGLLLLIICYLIFSKDKPAGVHFYTAKDSKYDNLAFAVKTGKDIAQKRAPIQFLTFLAPVRNILMIGEAPGVAVGDIPMIDVVTHLYDGVTLPPEKKRKKRKPKTKKKMVEGQEIAVEEVIPDEASEGWKSDAHKNLPGFRQLYEHYPNADWYIMIDDDTYVFMENLHFRLAHFKPEKPYYFGSANVFTGCDSVKKLGKGPFFAHGGSGIVLSKAAIKKLVPIIDSCLPKYHQCWAGDIRLALCLRDAGILLGDPLHFYRDPPHDKFNYTKPCALPNTFHHLLVPQVQKLYEIEMAARKKNKRGLVTMDEIFQNFINDDYKQDADRKGKPYAQKEMSQVEQCKEYCRQDLNCISYTLDGGLCFKKNQSNPLIYRKGAINGVIKEHFICNQKEFR
ncbi:hypothetical protein HDV06_000143 [Boothiomyces sp. JEL0866]|nr:hypothetical protein HDV06_000143 [Boothiomyces sp. JEL0866]